MAAQMSTSNPPSMIPQPEADFMHIDTTDFASMSRPEQIRHFEVEGYVVFPRILTPEIVAKVKSEMADAEMTHTSYSTQQQRSARQPQWVSQTAAELIGTMFRRTLDPFQTFLALGETLAHLNYLARKGVLTRAVGADGVVRFATPA